MYIKVRVIAGAKKEEVLETHKDHFTLRVRQRAERNLANKRVVELIARYFGLTPSRVRIISGHQHPIKMLSVDTPLS